MTTDLRGSTAEKHGSTAEGTSQSDLEATERRLTVVAMDAVNRLCEGREADGDGELLKRFATSRAGRRVTAVGRRLLPALERHYDEQFSANLSKSDVASKSNDASIRTRSRKLPRPRTRSHRSRSRGSADDDDPGDGDGDHEAQLCWGCGLPLVGYRPQAKYHRGEACRSQFRRDRFRAEAIERAATRLQAPKKTCRCHADVALMLDDHDLGLRCSSCAKRRLVLVAETSPVQGRPRSRETTINRRVEVAA